MTDEYTPEITNAYSSPAETRFFVDEVATPAAVAALFGVTEPEPEWPAEPEPAIEIARAPYLAVGETMSQEVADALISAYGDAVNVELAIIHGQVAASGVPAQAADAHVATADELMHWNGGYTPYRRGYADHDIFLGHYTFTVGDTGIRIYVALRWETGEIVSADADAAIARYAPFFAEASEDA